MKIAVKTLDNKAAGDITVSDEVFGIAPRGDLMARVVNWQLAKRRAGTHKAKLRSEIARTGAKIYNQKARDVRVTVHHRSIFFAAAGCPMDLIHVLTSIVCRKKCVAWG